jgi:hypothetical protein
MTFELKFYVLPTECINLGHLDFFFRSHGTFFNERIMMTIIQEDANTSRRRVVESSE